MERAVRLLTAAASLPLLAGAGAAAVGVQLGPERDHQVLFSFADPAITESSGLVALGGDRYATTNDSGDTGRVFTVDGSGETRGVSHWDPDARDVEALAQCEAGTVWVGDIGDNRGVRDTVRIAEVEVGPGERTQTPTRYELTYPDGPRDAETLLCHPEDGRLYVASKEFAGGTLYRVPRRLRAEAPNRLTEVAPVAPLATDGSFTPDGDHVVIRGYTSATVYAWPTMARVGGFGLPGQEQGEGLAVTGDGAVLLSSEGVSAPVLRVPIPPRLRQAMSEPSRSSSPSSSSSSPSPDPEQRSEQASKESEESGADPGWWWLVAGAGAAAALLLIGWRGRSRR